MRKRRNITPEYRQVSACLVLDQGYRVSEASRTVGVGENILRRWMDQLNAKRHGLMPVGNKALTTEQPRMRGLEAQIELGLLPLNRSKHTAKNLLDNEFERDEVTIWQAKLAKPATGYTDVSDLAK
jgi:transposase